MVVIAAHAQLDAFLQNRREIEASLFTARHDELARALLSPRARVMTGSDGLAAAAAMLGERLEQHAAMQSHVLFPAYVATRICASPLFERFTADAAALLDAATELLAICVHDDRAAAHTLREVALDVRDHLASEEELLRHWLAA